MKLLKIKLLVPLVAVLALIAGCASHPSSPSTSSSAKPASALVKHVVLISLDGSRPEFYMDTSWPAPHLQQLKNEGVYASKGVQSVFPSITYPSHTTIVTGAYPAEHGVYYNQPFEARPGHAYWYAGTIKCETLWDAIRAAGLTSGSVYWPLTVGAPVNYLFPIRRPEEGEKGNQLSLTIPYVRPRDLLDDVEQKTGMKFNGTSFAIKQDYRESKNIAIISNYIIKTYKPNFMALHFVGLDHQQHAHGTNSPQLRAVLKVTDSLVGTVMQAIKDAGIWDSTTVIITGDHGHTDVKATFAPNVYLAQHGLVSKDDWKAKFNAAGGSAFLYLKKQGDQAAVNSVMDILKNTAEYKEGDFRILDSAELKKVGGNPNTPLALAMKEGISVSNAIDGKTFRTHNPPYRSTHGFDPTYQSMHTTFIALGAGIGPHKDISGMGIKDIAPLVAKLLGLDFKAPDGVLIPGILAGQDLK